MEYLHFLYLLGKRRRGGGLVPNWSVPMNRPTSHEDSRSIPKTGLKPKLAMQTVSLVPLPYLHRGVRRFSIRFLPSGP